MDNANLIQTFVEHTIANQSIFLYNTDLRIEPVSASLELVSTSGGLVAVSQLVNGIPQSTVRLQSSHWETIHTYMVQAGFLPKVKSRMAGFYDYQKIAVPSGYQVHFTDALDILHAWWDNKPSGNVPSVLSMLILHRSHWYAIQDLMCEQGALLIRTLGETVKLNPLDRIVWLQKEIAEQQSSTRTEPAQELRDYQQSTSLPKEPRSSPQKIEESTTTEVPDIQSFSLNHRKRIGGYLMDAALLTEAQVASVLCDQQSTRMRFGEILVQRGWLKEQTIEFFMRNVILPQRINARRREKFASQ